jgi:hypothetical protein
MLLLVPKEKEALLDTGLLDPVPCPQEGHTLYSRKSPKACVRASVPFLRSIDRSSQAAKPGWFLVAPCFPSLPNRDASTSRSSAAREGDPPDATSPGLARHPSFPPRSVSFRFVPPRFPFLIWSVVVLRDWEVARDGGAAGEGTGRLRLPHQAASHRRQR